jgi:hypothetical protein
MLCFIRPHDIQANDGVQVRFFRSFASQLRKLDVILPKFNKLRQIGADCDPKLPKKHSPSAGTIAGCNWAYYQHKLIL